MDGGITEPIDDDPLLGLGHLMLGDDLFVSHDGMTHARTGLYRAEDGDELIMPVAARG